jgi:hypothetical protein
VIDRHNSNWLWQFAKDLPSELALRKDLQELALRLSSLRAAYEDPHRKYSEMVSNRIQNALSDYWRAVDAAAVRKFNRCARLTRAGKLEADFIKQLMDAENAEAELGEGEFFEFSDTDTLTLKLSDFLRRQELELLALGAEAKSHVQQ